jgi:hypothetical protein
MMKTKSTIVDIKIAGAVAGKLVNAKVRREVERALEAYSTPLLVRRLQSMDYAGCMRKFLYVPRLARGVGCHNSSSGYWFPNVEVLPVEAACD